MTNDKTTMMPCPRCHGAGGRQQEILDAVVARLLELGYGPGPAPTVAERARGMIDQWSWFSDNSMNERGHETCRDWIDPELCRLFDEHLRVTTDDRAT
jgi:hypothetical protein